MSLKIKPYIKFLLKEHLPYFFGAVLMIVLTIYFIASFSMKTTQDTQKKQALKEELSVLRTRKNLVLAAEGPDKQNIAEDLAILHTLVPDAEDYFSILYTLENLSQQTNFNITSYILNPKESSSDKLALVISGEGNQREFLDFLSQYNFGGGRLLTADKIEFGSDSGTQTKLNIYAYHQSAPKENLTSSKTDAKKLMEMIKPKLHIQMVQSSSPGASLETSDTYETKTNPF